MDISLWAIMNRSAVNTHGYGHVFISLDSVPKSGIAVSIKIHMTSLVLGNSKLFQGHYTILLSYQPDFRVLTSPHSSKHLILSDFLITNVKVTRFKIKSLTTNH